MNLQSRLSVLLLVWCALLLPLCAGQTKSHAKSKKKPKQAAPSAAQNLPKEDYSGMYSFLKEGEFVQITIDEGQLSGFVSRLGDMESDRGLFLDQFFDKATIKDNQISFTTKPVHGIWHEFQGQIDRGPAKTKKEEGYWLLNGNLKENRTDADGKVSSRTREVSFKSFPEDDETGDEEESPPERKK